MAFSVLIIFLFTAVFGKLIYLQLISGKKLQVKALDQWSRDIPITGERGNIFDINGKILADTATLYTVYARPNSVKDKSKTAQILGNILNVNIENLYNRLNSKVSEVTVCKKATGEQISLIYNNDVSGVYYSQNIERKYIYGDFLSMVMGFTNVDGVGQTGIEAYYNEYLQGKNGKILTETDLVGRELENNVTHYIKGEKGADVYLTIDYAIQSFIQNAVNQAYNEQQAKAVSCIMLNTKTGAIIGMAKAPSFDLNDVPRDDISYLMSVSKNTIVTDVYEPGSTFKVLTSSIGLENGTVNPNSTRCYCPGYRIVDGNRIKCWRTIGHGSQSFSEGVQNSCNCMFMDIALGLGKDKLYEGLKKFGIGEKTGVDISGEGKGLLIDIDTVKNVDTARIGFGQAVAVTAIELISACCAAINGGELLKPYIVDKAVSNDGIVLYKGEKTVQRKAISEQTSLIMREVLEEVVKEGGGKNAQVEGYRIGGKTGTAQKYNKETGLIDRGKYIATFMGFAPADDPEYIMLFIVDEPSAGAYYGSVVAAPYASIIFKNLFNYKGIKPINIKEKEKIIMPDLLGLTISEATTVLNEKGLYFEYYEGTETGNKVSYQLPVAGSEITSDNVVYISLS